MSATSHADNCPTANTMAPGRNSEDHPTQASGHWSLIFQLILAEGGYHGLSALLVAVLSGVIQAALVHLIASDAESLAHQALGPQDLLMFLSILGGFALILMLNLRLTTRVSDRLTTQVGLRLAGFVRVASLPVLEGIGADRVMTAVTRDLTTISSSIPLAFSTIQTTALITVCALLIAATSPMVAVAGGLALLVLGLLARRLYGAMRQASVKAAAAEGAFCVQLEHALTGFRELAVNDRKRDDLYDEWLLPQAEEARYQRLTAGACFVRQMQLTHGAWFALVGAAAFIAPSLDIPDGATTAVLILAFLRAPMVDMSSYLPSILNARLAIQRFYALETALEDGVLRETTASTESRSTRASSTTGFQSLALEGVSYHYHDQDGSRLFSVGPIDLTFRAGEVILVSGGNGSGKTTFLKLLTGLYPPASGRILIDGHPPAPSRLQAQFSTVFTDFHLFQRLYGLESIDPAESDTLLRALDLAHKVFIRDGAFSTTALSSGQRRRLALIAACLEHRPVLMFDEWTADQDPTFRRYFYETLLPTLKAEGRTIIAVTHDQFPVPCADRRLVLQGGKLSEILDGPERNTSGDKY